VIEDHGVKAFLFKIFLFKMRIEKMHRPRIYTIWPPKEKEGEGESRLPGFRLSIFSFYIKY
jgi:hypothetical protein